MFIQLNSDILVILCLSIYICIYRLFTGPKDSSIFDILSTTPYKSVMANNVDLDLSFDSEDKSIEKTLQEPKRAFFSFEANVDPIYKCKV